MWLNRVSLLERVKAAGYYELGSQPRRDTEIAGRYCSTGEVVGTDNAYILMYPTERGFEYDHRTSNRKAPWKVPYVEWHGVTHSCYKSFGAIGFRMSAWNYIINLVGNKTSVMTFVEHTIQPYAVDYLAQHNVVAEQRDNDVVVYHKDFRVIWHDNDPNELHQVWVAV